MKYYNPSYSGFTLLELLISVSIMLLMVGVGITSFLTFNDKQQVIGATRELQSFFRSAQTKARIGDKPVGCDNLQSYSVRVDEGSSDVSLVAVCSSGEVVRNTQTLKGLVSPSTDVNVDFLVLKGGVIGAGDVTMVSNNGELNYTFGVTSGGEITEGSFNE